MPLNHTMAVERDHDLEILSRRVAIDVRVPRPRHAPFVITADQFDAAIGRAWMMGAAVAIHNAEGRRTCRVCGCHDKHACADGCAWSGPDLCTACEA